MLGFIEPGEPGAGHQFGRFPARSQFIDNFEQASRQSVIYFVLQSEVDLIDLRQLECQDDNKEG